MMFKSLVIPAANNLSDEGTEFLINDRLAFMRFLGLSLSDRVPDARTNARTIWLFREKLTKAGTIPTLFERFDAMLRAAGYIAMSIENLTAAVDAARRSIESLASPFHDITSGFGEAFAAAFAVHEVERFAEAMAALGTETSRASQILGVSTEEVAALKLVAQASGGSLEELQHAFGFLSANVVGESDKAKRALAALGLSFTDIKNRAPIEQLKLLAIKFQEFTDGEEKNAIAKAFLRRAGQQLIPIFNQGAEGSRNERRRRKN